MSPIYASAAAIAVGLLCLRTGRGPIRLLVRALNHVSAAGLWVRREVGPAIARVAPRYWECVREVERRG